MWPCRMKPQFELFSVVVLVFLSLTSSAWYEILDFFSFALNVGIEDCFRVWLDIHDNWLSQI